MDSGVWGNPPFPEGSEGSWRLGEARGTKELCGLPPGPALHPPRCGLSLSCRAESSP